MAASGPGPPGDGVVRNSALSFVAPAQGLEAGEPFGSQDTGEQSTSSNQADRLVPAGLKALYDACSKLYHDQPNPLQVTTRLKYWLGGEDPLDYISMYWHPGVPEEQVPPHWHYVSFGLSDLHGDGRVHAAPEPGAASGFGLELTLRLAAAGGAPPLWPAALLQALARYVFTTGNKFCAGDHISWHAPLDASASRVRHLLVADDARLPRVNTPHGSVAFLQLVGCTGRELRAAQRSSGFEVLKLLQEDHSCGGSWLVTQVARRRSARRVSPAAAPGPAHLAGVSCRLRALPWAPMAIDDGLPQQMCARCISFSNAALKFRKQCKDAETRLLQVKNEYDGAAGTLHSGAVDSEGFSDKDMPLELKAEEDSEIDDGDVTVKSEADSEVENNGSGALQTTEEDLLQLKPAGGAGAAPECTHTRPEERPPCSTGHKQQFNLSSCFVRLERFPVEDLHHNLHTCKTCLMTFGRDSSLRNHSCSVQETNFNEVWNETAEKTHYKCDLCGKQYVQKRHIIRHLAAHNVKLGDEKPVLYSSDDAKFANTEEISYSDNVSETPSKKNQSAMTILTGERQGSQKRHLIRHIRKPHRDDIHNMTDKYICERCKKGFRYLSQLTVHIRVHTREKLFSCNICMKRFTCISYLTRHRRIHMRTHTGEKPFSCDDCMKQFTDVSSLTRHRQIHTGEKPYCCGVCSKQFAQKSSLSRHMLLHTGVKNYSCDICKKKFTHKGTLITHVRTHTGEKPFSCDDCMKQFTDVSSLTRHRQIHTGEKPYCCGVCNKQFAQKTNLSRHMLLHTGVKNYGCGICKKKFTHKGTLITHLRTHTGEKPFSCDDCMKQFTDVTSLTRHRQIHTGEKPYCCGVCNKQFAQKTNLSRHMLLHTGVKNYSCDICKKKFTQKGTLITHVRTHTGEKPFSCDDCMKQFTDVTSLTRHRQIHTGEKPYCCGVCNKQFAQKTNLSRHMLLHTGVKNYSCDICKKKFTHKGTLITHMRTHTGEKLFSCDDCMKQFTDVSSLTRHRQIHTGKKPYCCSVCNKQFSRKTSLSRHVLSHTGVKNYSCDICKKKFTLKGTLTKHMRTHTGEKPFSCDVCMEQFTQSGKLTRHRRIHTGEKPRSRGICQK